MANPSKPWWVDHQLWVEAFATLNIGFMTLDIFLAHSVNQFRRPEEYVPLLFSALSPVLMLTALFQRTRRPLLWKVLGYIVSSGAILMGLTGVILHLQSHFFLERTIRSLTYSAPFAAPLAYTGVGFLLLLDRMVDTDSIEWAQWVLLFTLGGYFGNFIFSLTDHAANGFFYPLEWVPVVASAFAVGFLVIPLVMQVPRQFLTLCGVLLLGEAAIGVWGFFLHGKHNLHGPSSHLFNNLIYGAAPIAPLLFPNLMVLGLIALWRLRLCSTSS